MEVVRDSDFRLLAAHSIASHQYGSSKMTIIGTTLVQISSSTAGCEIVRLELSSDLTVPVNSVRRYFFQAMEGISNMELLHITNEVCFFSVGNSEGDWNVVGESEVSPQILALRHDGTSKSFVLSAIRHLQGVCVLDGHLFAIGRRKEDGKQIIAKYSFDDLTKPVKLTELETSVHGDVAFVLGKMRGQRDLVSCVASTGIVSLFDSSLNPVGSHSQLPKRGKHQDFRVVSCFQCVSSKDSHCLVLLWQSRSSGLACTSWASKADGHYEFVDVVDCPLFALEGIAVQGDGCFSFRDTAFGRFTLDLQSEHPRLCVKALPLRGSGSSEKLSEAVISQIRKSVESVQSRLGENGSLDAYSLEALGEAESLGLAPEVLATGSYAPAASTSAVEKTPDVVLCQVVDPRTGNWYVMGENCVFHVSLCDCKGRDYWKQYCLVNSLQNVLTREFKDLVMQHCLKSRAVLRHICLSAAFTDSNPLKPKKPLIVASFDSFRKELTDAAEQIPAEVVKMVKHYLNSADTKAPQTVDSYSEVVQTSLSDGVDSPLSVDDILGEILLLIVAGKSKDKSILQSTLDDLWKRVATQYCAETFTDRRYEYLVRAALSDPHKSSREYFWWLLLACESENKFRTIEHTIRTIRTTPQAHMSTELLSELHSISSAYVPSVPRDSILSNHAKENSTYAFCAVAAFKGFAASELEFLKELGQSQLADFLSLGLHSRLVHLALSSRQVSVALTVVTQLLQESSEKFARDCVSSYLTFSLLHERASDLLELAKVVGGTGWARSLISSELSRRLDSATDNRSILSILKLLVALHFAWGQLREAAELCYGVYRSACQAEKDGKAKPDLDLLLTTLSLCLVAVNKHGSAMYLSRCIVSSSVDSSAVLASMEDLKQSIVKLDVHLLHSLIIRECLLAVFAKIDGCTVTRSSSDQDFVRTAGAVGLFHAARSLFIHGVTRPGEGTSADARDLLIPQVKFLGQTCRTEPVSDSSHQSLYSVVHSNPGLAFSGDLLDISGPRGHAEQKPKLLLRSFLESFEYALTRPDVGTILPLVLDELLEAFNGLPTMVTRALLKCGYMHLLTRYCASRGLTSDVLVLLEKQLMSLVPDPLMPSLVPYVDISLLHQLLDQAIASEDPLATTLDVISRGCQAALKSQLDLYSSTTRAHEIFQ